MINYAVDEVEKNYKGLVIGNQSKNFCVGANLAMILMEAQDDNYFEIELVVKNFQDAMTKIKYSSKPVVAKTIRYDAWRRYRSLLTSD